MGSVEEGEGWCGEMGAVVEDSLRRWNKQGTEKEREYKERTGLDARGMGKKTREGGYFSQFGGAHRETRNNPCPEERHFCARVRSRVHERDTHLRCKIKEVLKTQ